jgi:hypothetical protein
MLIFTNLPLTPDQHERALAAAHRVFERYETTPAACWPVVNGYASDRKRLRAWYAAEDAAVVEACQSWRKVPPGARMDWEPADEADQ